MPPQLKGAALVIPAGLLRDRKPEPLSPSPSFVSEDPASRREIELLAMDAVMAAERRMGHAPVDVSSQNKGWDIESRESRTGQLRFIEVKGRHADARDVILTKNELLASLNTPESFFLALVSVDQGFAQAPVYVQRFFNRDIGFEETAVVFDISKLLALANGGSTAR